MANQPPIWKYEHGGWQTDAKLLARGKFDTVGWDIPTEWCVDREGDAWQSNGHGGPLNQPVVLQRLINEIQVDIDSLQRDIQALVAAQVKERKQTL